MPEFYCTKADILKQVAETVLIQLTDDANVGAVDDAIVEQEIENAAGEINGYCAERYPVPLSPVPPIIRKFSVDIAIYNLFARRKGASDDRKARYDNAIRFLRNVSSGRVSLGASAPEPVTTTDSVAMESGTRIFTRDKMSGF
jgi:phage gp36-like protein